MGGNNSSARHLDFVTLDVFTNTPFTGNPLAIFHVPSNITLEQNRKQAIAREFNLSETFFLYEGDGKSLNSQIDIFTTSSEVPFSGHPTIGTICYLYADRQSGTDSAGPVAVSFDHVTRPAMADIPHNINIHQSHVHRRYIVEAQPHLVQSQTHDSQRQLEAWSRREDGLEAEFPIFP